MNKNSVPNDPKSPFVTSGIRIGTPAVTRRGFKEEEVSTIADWISQIIVNLDDKTLISNIKEEVKAFVVTFQFTLNKPCTALFVPSKKVRLSILVL